MPEKCPTCDSAAPHLHPAVQHEGEVQPCRDVYHERVTPENTIESVQNLRELLARFERREGHDD